MICHTDFANGTSRVDTYKVGDGHFRAKDSIPPATNVGNARYINVIVELKGRDGQGSAVETPAIKPRNSLTC